MRANPAAGQQGALPRGSALNSRTPGRNTMLAGDLTVAETYDGISDTPGPISSSAHCISTTYQTLAPALVDHRFYT